MKKKIKKIKEGRLTNRGKEVLEKLIGKGRKMSIGKAMRESGFSNNYADQPSKFMRSQGVKNFLSELKRKRKQSLDALTKAKIDKAQYDKLVEGIEKMTKMVELLEGRETERRRVIIVDL